MVVLAGAEAGAESGKTGLKATLMLEMLEGLILASILESLPIGNEIRLPWTRGMVITSVSEVVEKGGDIWQLFNGGGGSDTLLCWDAVWHLLGKRGIVEFRLDSLNVGDVGGEISEMRCDHVKLSPLSPSLKTKSGGMLDLLLRTSS